MIVDTQGRQFRNLRLSLTAACNYACTYCVPDGKRLMAAAAELEAKDMVYLVRLLMLTAGIKKLRITGGEPLLSAKFDDLLPALMALCDVPDGLEDVAITTNGQLLPRKAELIEASGLRRMNISLDTLDAAHFRDIARSGDLATVLHGIELMREAGLRLKVNMVPMRGINDDQVLPMLEYCLDRDIELRFIELMNMGHLQSSAAHKGQYREQFFGMTDILERIGRTYSFQRIDAPYDSTAARFEIPGYGRFGVIANESEPFCAGCSRLRVSSNGHLFGCLSSAKSHDLNPLLDASEPEAIAELQEVLRSALADKQSVSFRGEVTVMKFIGG